MEAKLLEWQPEIGTKSIPLT